ncbi:DUF4279 domain-containing protein [Variovorax guangxiensis]|uniref:DUF4279 domain-containing protein n=1 Tax=Variovorax guangxiensis TaxID=1775474 RepID=A0A433MMD6_9BURK|nr:DUF4279 domain-containing protein [Variovorax guangxiensis]RUR68815.1 DUF4279 domain-containing protein [Variovorax guangxiensis]
MTAIKRLMQLDFQLLGTTTPPKEISTATGISPDVELEQGERNRELNLPRQNVWSIKSKVKSEVLAEHWEDLERSLKPSIVAIKDAAQTGRAVFTVVVTGEGRIPSIQIPSGMSMFAGLVNAVIDIDHLQY